MQIARQVPAGVSSHMFYLEAPSSSTPAHSPALVPWPRPCTDDALASRFLKASLIASIEPLCRNDGSPPVRHAAVHVWKSVVVNTPRTLRQILPRLMDICVSAIAGSGEEARVTASRCLGELVRKMSHQARPCAAHPRIPHAFGRHGALNSPHRPACA